MSSWRRARLITHARGSRSAFSSALAGRSARTSCCAGPGISRRTRACLPPCSRRAPPEILTYRELLGFIKATLPLLGFPAALFGTHSLRIGGATQMALSGYSAAQIQAAGRWSSDCYLVYIRLGDAFFRSLASALSASADSSLSPFGPLSAVQAAGASFDNLPALVARPGTF